MASLIYNKALEFVAKGSIDFDTDTFYAMLVTSSYTPDKDAHDFRNDVTNEVSGTGYTADGKPTAAVVTLDTANDRVNVTFGDVTWTAVSGFTAAAAVIYKHRGGASSADELVAYAEFTSGVTPTGGDFTLHFTSPFRFQN